jgi:hypothetical protein
VISLIPEQVTEDKMLRKAVHLLNRHHGLLASYSRLELSNDYTLQLRVIMPSPTQHGSQICLGASHTFREAYLFGNLNHRAIESALRCWFRDCEKQLNEMLGQLWETSTS